MKRKLTMEDVVIRLCEGLSVLDLIWISIALAAIVLVVLVAA